MNPRSGSLTSSILAEAGRLGFALAGVTTADPPPHSQAFAAWLAAGRHGSMKYLEDPRRADPRQVLPGCRSVLVLAIRYSNPGIPVEQEQTGLTGRLASYAWGRDYHRVLPGRLRALVAFIESRTGAPLAHRLYTDTGPLLERDLAQRAGLGWIGRNTCLIHPRLGSYLLLAEILFELDLDPSPPFSFDRCGTCRRCVQACPTGCILPDRTIDARRCISYLTIENRGDIPPDLRPRLGDWVFGCDICQQVCPWNRRAGSACDPALEAPPETPAPDLCAELALTPQEFNRRYRTTPLERSRRSGYRRNLAVALGNSGRPEAIPALEAAAADPDPLVARHAAWALERLRIE